MKRVLLLFLGAAAIVFWGFLPEAGADVIKRAMYINSGGQPVYEYVFQADRYNLRSWRRSYYDSGSYGYSSPYYFGSSYVSPGRSYYRSAYGARTIFGGRHCGGYHGYHGGIRAHGAFSVGGLRVHVRL